MNNSTVFKTAEFISMLGFKRYWGSDYTKHTNEIGLTRGGKYLKYNEDIVLDFPYKDSVLEGGIRTKERVDNSSVGSESVISKSFGN